MYGHIHRLAEAVSEGVKEVAQAEPVLRRVPETLSENILEAMGALEVQKSFSHIPVCTIDELASSDAIIFGNPNRFGNMCGQMRQFLDATGQLWMKGALVGKAGSVFASSGTQHGGQESTILSFHCTLLHQSMVIVGLPTHFRDRCEMTRLPVAHLMEHQPLRAQKGRECRQTMSSPERASREDMLRKLRQNFRNGEHGLFIVPVRR